MPIAHLFHESMSQLYLHTRHTYTHWQLLSSDHVSSSLDHRDENQDTCPPVPTPPRHSRSRKQSASVAAEEPSQNLQVDALGMAHILRTESLTAICLLIIA